MNQEQFELVGYAVCPFANQVRFMREDGEHDFSVRYLDHARVGPRQLLEVSELASPPSLTVDGGRMTMSLPILKDLNECGDELHVPDEPFWRASTRVREADRRITLFAARTVEQAERR